MASMQRSDEPRARRRSCAAPGAAALGTLVRGAALGTLVAGAALGALVAGPALAASAHSAQPTPAAPRETVLRGEVVETGCFVMAGRRGEAHRQCAIACARAGQDLAVLDDKTKTAFLLVQDFTAGTPENPLLEHVGHRVEVRGTTVERGGIRGIIVRQVKPLGAGARR